MKKLLIALVTAITVCACNNASPKVQSVIIGETQDSTSENINNQKDMQTETKFKISTSKGDMIVKLYDETPLHKENFTKLALQRFYNGILFHRVINGFMIQCGDPLTKDRTRVGEWGTGGPGYTIPAEIVEGLTHKKGALAAARLGDVINPEKKSSGSQFYIVQSESGCKHLDGQYTVFGEVIEGLDVIDKIASATTGRADCPIEDIEIVSITLVH